MLNIGEFARFGPVSPRMLRHYDQLALLQPAAVDSSTGYRFYSVEQLPRLHEILALRDLGLGIEQIKSVLNEKPTVEQLRGMLQLRRSQIEATIEAEREQLARVEAHLQAIERNNEMSLPNVVVKEADPLRIVERTKTVAGYGYVNISPAFKELVPLVLADLERHGITPKFCVGYYENPSEDGSVVAHVGFEIGDQDVNGVHVVAMPRVKVASILHQGTFENIDPVYEELFRWIDDGGYRPSGLCRELYLEWNSTDESKSITEIQTPITSA